MKKNCARKYFHLLIFVAIKFTHQILEFKNFDIHICFTKVTRSVLNLGPVWRADVCAAKT